MNHFRKVILSTLFFICSLSLFGEYQGKNLNRDFFPAVSDQLAAQEGEFYRISIITAAPGDRLSELYFWWGHTAIAVEDLRTGGKTVYDFGVFSMNEDKIIMNFMGGRIDYLIASRPPFYFEPMIHGFLRGNRWVVEQTLDLEPAGVYRLAQYLKKNARRGNNKYKYHFYLENCCTKIRDLVDFAVEGQLYAQTYVPAEENFRVLGRQYLSKSFLADWGLNFLLSGAVVDQPATKWDHMFLPYEFMNILQDFRYKDSRGRERKLVTTRIEHIPPVKRNEFRAMGVENGDLSQGDPQRIRRGDDLSWLTALFFGIAVGAVGALLFLFGTKSLAVRIIGGVYSAVILLILFLISLILFYMAFFSTHDVTWNNMNLVLVNPFTMFTAFVLSILYAADIGKSKLVYGWFWMLMATVAAGQLIFKLGGFYLQDNLMVLTALLPLFLLMAVSALFRDRLGRKRNQDEGESA